MSFQARWTGGRARVGTWRVREKSLSTPGALVYTHRGLISHLTPDMSRQLDTHGVIVCILNEYDVKKDTTKLNRLCAHEGTLTVASFRDCLHVSPNLMNGDQFTTIRSDRGDRKYRDWVAKSGFDVLTPMADSLYSHGTNSLKRVKKSVDRSLKFLDSAVTWAQENGNGFIEERKRSAEETAKRPVSAFLLEGMGIGESMEERREHIEAAIEYLPADKPRILIGLNTIEEILNAVESGVDLVDASMALHATDQGTALNLSSTVHTLNLHDARFQRDQAPLVDECDCFACRNHTRAYIHHLLNTHELLAPILLMQYARYLVLLIRSHNLAQLLNFFKRLREHMEAGKFAQFKSQYSQ